jgi:ADP-dependent NAD(P)H-hydrate dehydratase / NAD(P)H-hydrate epimerase
LLASRSALAIGPGLGTAAETRAAVLEILSRIDHPAVVDADALNAIASAGRPQRRRLSARAEQTVLTPHPGEAGRLLARSTADIERDRLASAREIARQTGAIVVLKGHRTIVATPDGRASINGSGNPGLATAGTGDVLTGVVGAFLGRGLAPRDAARAAVFLHGAAGDRAAAEVGEQGLIASDVIDRLPAAIAALSSGA